MSNSLDLIFEEEPPRFLRAQALPYPDLKRVWARVELTTFVEHPDLAMTIFGPDGVQEASMVMVDVQHTYISLTMHLKRAAPDQPYRLLLQLTRGELLLDQRTVPFDLTFVERSEAMAEAEALRWPQRAVPVTPLSGETPDAPANGAV